MEEKLRKKRIRKIVGGIIVLILAAVAIAGFSFEAADYNKELTAQIASADKAIQEAELGNEKGQYSEYVMASFVKDVDKARTVLEKKDVKNKELKKEYKSLKDSLNEFKQSGNSNVLTAEELDKVKKEGKAFEKEVELSDREIVKWTIQPEKIKKTSAINLDADVDNLYEKELSEIRKTLKKEGTSIAFMHNGKMPVKSDVSMKFETEMKNIQIYHYDTKTSTFGKMIKGSVKDNTVSFTINEGGIYMLLNTDVKDAGKVTKTLNKITNKKITEDRKEKKKHKNKAENKEENDSESTGSESSSESGQSSENQSDNGSDSNNNDNSSSSEAAKPSAPEAEYCTVEIRCDTIVDTSKLTNQSVAKYVPSDGTILATTQVELEEGDTAFDVLQRVTRQYAIQMEFSFSNVYNSAYIEGINNIYEFDAGGGSGWMYKVNGWFPNYGCSNYEMEPGDEMVWCYTCNIGKDVGDQYYEDHPDANPQFQ